MNKYPLPKVIAVDVDGTLHVNGVVNTRLVDWLRERKADGYELMLWSMRGRPRCEAAIDRFDLSGLFDVVCSKPGLLVDDKGWQWTRYTRTIMGNRALNEHNPD